MAFHFTSKLVTDGLILCVDAANHRSYISGSTTWNDTAKYAGSGNLINGPVYSSANFGSIVLDGLNDYVEFQPLPVINNLAQGAFTVAAWINPASFGVGTARIVEKRWNDGIFNGSWNGFLFFVNTATNGIRVQILRPGAIDAQSTGIVTGTFLNTWSYVAMTCNYLTDKTIRLYLNGVELSYTLQTPGTGIPGDDSLGNMRIGQSHNFDRAFNGRVAQTHLYNRVLSASELLQNYNIHKFRYGL